MQQKDARLQVRWFLFALIVMPLSVLVFSKYRSIVMGIEDLANSAANNSGSAYNQGANATALAEACEAACGVGSTCDQTKANTVLCTSCADGSTPLRSTCSSKSSHCLATPWCSSVDASTVSTVHNALITAAVEYARSQNQQDVGLYPTGDAGATAIMSSRFWSTLQAQVGSASDSIALVNLFVLGRMYIVAHNSTESAATWFNDQTGWWGSSLPSYEEDVSAPYLDYIYAVKRRVCTRTWTGAEACLPPGL